jgi:hypothetical protein
MLLMLLLLLLSADGVLQQTNTTLALTCSQL